MIKKVFGGGKKPPRKINSMTPKPRMTPKRQDARGR